MVRHRGEVDDPDASPCRLPALPAPRAPPPPLLRHQAHGEEPVAQVVGLELQLVALGALQPLRRGHDPRVADQQREVLAAGVEVVGEAAHAVQRRQVQLPHLHAAPLAVGKGRLAPEPLRRGLGFCLAPARQHDVPAQSGQLLCGGQAYACVASRYHTHLHLAEPNF